MVRVRRSIISVPGHNAKMIAKATTLPADVVMLDLEDSVPLEHKEEARVRVIEALRQLEWGDRVKACRINDLNNSHAYRDLVDVLEEAGDHLDIIVIPKVETAADVQFVDTMIRQIETRFQRSPRLGIEASVETARGMLNVKEIAFASERLEALVFGIADYAASLTMPAPGVSAHGDAEEGYPGHRWHFPLSRLAMAAKAAGLAVIDAPYGDFRDQAGLEKSCRLALSLGYDGKWAIHPAQLETINRVFTPAPEAIARAQDIVEALARAREAGLGAAAIDGKMVDAASIRVAKATLLLAEKLGLLAGKPT